jgi:hypothetical protein
MEENLRISKLLGCFPVWLGREETRAQKIGVSAARHKENSQFFERGETNGQQMRIGNGEFFGHNDCIGQALELVGVLLLNSSG